MDDGRDRDAARRLCELRRLPDAGEQRSATRACVREPSGRRIAADGRGRPTAGGSSSAIRPSTRWSTRRSPTASHRPAPGGSAAARRAGDRAGRDRGRYPTLAANAAARASTSPRTTSIRRRSAAGRSTIDSARSTSATTSTSGAATARRSRRRSRRQRRPRPTRGRAARAVDVGRARLVPAAAARQPARRDRAGDPPAQRRLEARAAALRGRHRHEGRARQAEALLPATRGDLAQIDEAIGSSATRSPRCSARVRTAAARSAAARRRARPRARCRRTAGRAARPPPRHRRRALAGRGARRRSTSAQAEFYPNINLAASAGFTRSAGARFLSAAAAMVRRRRR